MLPVVWLLGTSGVGKSTVGYRLLSELADHGIVAAFVDADQLRLAANVEASETQLIAAGLRELMLGYQQAGARVLIVAGRPTIDRSSLSFCPACRASASSLAISTPMPR